MSGRSNMREKINQGRQRNNKISNRAKQFDRGEKSSPLVTTVSIKKLKTYLSCSIIAVKKLLFDSTFHSYSGGLFNINLPQLILSWEDLHPCCTRLTFSKAEYTLIINLIPPIIISRQNFHKQLCKLLLQNNISIINST